MPHDSQPARAQAPDYEAALAEASKRLADAFLLYQKIRFWMGKGRDPGVIPRTDAYPFKLQAIWEEDTKLLRLIDETAAQVLQIREEGSAGEWNTRVVVITEAGIFQAYSARAALRLAAEAMPAFLKSVTSKNSGATR